MDLLIFKVTGELFWILKVPVQTSWSSPYFPYSFWNSLVSFILELIINSH